MLPISWYPLNLMIRTCWFSDTNSHSTQVLFEILRISPSRCLQGVPTSPPRGSNLVECVCRTDREVALFIPSRIRFHVIFRQQCRISVILRELSYKTVKYSAVPQYRLSYLPSKLGLDVDCWQWHTERASKSVRSCVLIHDKSITGNAHFASLRSLVWAAT